MFPVFDDDCRYFLQSFPHPFGSFLDFSFHFHSKSMRKNFHKKFGLFVIVSFFILPTKIHFSLSIKLNLLDFFLFQLKVVAKPKQSEAGINIHTHTHTHCMDVVHLFSYLFLDYTYNHQSFQKRSSKKPNNNV